MHKRGLGPGVHRLDAPSGEAQPRSTHPQRALAQLGLHQLLHHGSLHLCRHQLHGAVQQFVVSYAPASATSSVHPAGATTHIFQFPGSPGPVSPRCVAEGSPLPCRRRPDQPHDRHLREPHAGDVDGAAVLSDERRRPAANGSHPSGVAILVRCLPSTGKIRASAPQPSVESTAHPYALNRSSAL